MRNAAASSSRDKGTLAAALSGRDGNAETLLELETLLEILPAAEGVTDGGGPDLPCMASTSGIVGEGRKSFKKISKKND